MKTTPTISDESIGDLEYIVKSHACTQVGFDKYSLEDYPKMIEAILQWHKRLLADFAEHITPEKWALASDLFAVPVN
jgi:hypothetical protein